MNKKETVEENDHRSSLIGEPLEKNKQPKIPLVITQPKVKVLLAGGTGFFGGHVKKELEDRGYDVSVFHRTTYNLLSYEATRAAFKDIKPKIVVNLAALQGGIKFNKDKPVEMLDQNTQIALNIFKACNEFNIEKMLYILPSCAFPDGGEVITEGSLNDGKPNPSVESHSYSKRIQHALAVAYKKEYDLNTIGVAVTNLYGPNANFDKDTSKVVEATIRKVVEANTNEDPSIEMWGSGDPLRQFMYAPDAARALVTLLEEYEGDEIINVGTVEETSIKQLVEATVKIVGYTGEIKWNGQPDGQMRKMLEVKRLKDFIDPEEFSTLEAGLKASIEWYTK